MFLKIFFSQKRNEMKCQQVYLLPHQSEQRRPIVSQQCIMPHSRRWVSKKRKSSQELEIQSPRVSFRRSKYKHPFMVCEF